MIAYYLGYSISSFYFMRGRPPVCRAWLNLNPSNVKVEERKRCYCLGRRNVGEEELRLLQVMKPQQKWNCCSSKLRKRSLIQKTRTMYRVPLKFVSSISKLYLVFVPPCFQPLTGSSLIFVPSVSPGSEESGRAFSPLSIMLKLSKFFFSAQLYPGQTNH